MLTQCYKSLMKYYRRPFPKIGVIVLLMKPTKHLQSHGVSQVAIGVKMETVNSPPVIAIVDDDAEVSETLSALLQESGFEPIVCASIADFTNLGDPPPVDLALIDLRLRGESGLTLAVRLGQQYSLPVVMLTGVGDEIDKIIGLETGADDYLMKPFNPRELVARIRAVLRRYGHGVNRISSTSGQTVNTFYWNISCAIHHASFRGLNSLVN